MGDKIVMFWNKNDNFKNIVFLAMAVFLILFIAQIKNTALLAFASFVLACSLSPAVDKLSKLKYISRELASTIVILTTLLIVVLFLVPVVTISVQEIHQLISNIPVFISKIISFLNNKMLFGKALIEYINIEAITTASSKMASEIVNKSVNVTVGLMEAITILITMGVIVFYLTCEKHLLRDAVIMIFPPKMKERAKEVYESIEKKVGGYVLAQILSMTTVAIITALGLMLLKVQYAVLLGLIAGLLDIVPIVGPTIAFVLGVICASPQGILIVVLTIMIVLLLSLIIVVRKERGRRKKNEE